MTHPKLGEVVVSRVWPNRFKVGTLYEVHPPGRPTVLHYIYDWQLGGGT